MRTTKLIHRPYHDGVGGPVREHRAAHLAARGPLGVGMVRLWQEMGPEQNALDLVAVADQRDDEL